MSCIFACHAFARVTGLLGPTGRVFLCCGPSPGHGVDPHRIREDPSIWGRWLACAMFVFPLREGRIMHRRGIGFVKGVGMSGIMGGAEWSGVEWRDGTPMCAYCMQGKVDMFWWMVHMRRKRMAGTKKEGLPCIRFANRFGA
jgi:hypothetical protein